MDTYRLNFAVFCTAACGFVGMVAGVIVKMLGIAPVLTPAIASLFVWWPMDLLYSGALIGASCGVVGAIIGITLDIWREAALRDFAPRQA